MVELQSERVAIRLTPTEARMLRELADRAGCTVTDLLRMQIRREHERAFGEQPARKQKPKR